VLRSGALKTSRPTGDDVGEGAAAIQPELPAAIFPRLGLQGIDGHRIHPVARLPGFA
jgi:hypothetical protein